MSQKGKEKAADETEVFSPEKIDSAVDIVTNMAWTLVHDRLSWGEVRFAVARLSDIPLATLVSIADPTISDARADRLFQQLLETTGLAGRLGIAASAGPSHSQGVEGEPASLTSPRTSSPAVPDPAIPHTIESVSVDDPSGPPPFTQEELNALVSRVMTVVDWDKRTKQGGDVDTWIQDFVPRYQLSREMYRLIENDEREYDDRFEQAFSQIGNEQSAILRNGGNIDAALERFEKEQQAKALLRQDLEQSWNRVVDDVTKAVKEAEDIVDVLHDEQQRLVSDLRALESEGKRFESVIWEEWPLFAQIREINAEAIDRFVRLNEYLLQPNLAENYREELLRERDFYQRHLDALQKIIRIIEISGLLRLSGDGELHDKIRAAAGNIGQWNEILNSMLEQLRDELKLQSQSEMADPESLEQLEREHSRATLKIQLAELTLSQEEIELSPEEEEELEESSQEEKQRRAELQETINKLSQFGLPALRKFDPQIRKLGEEINSLENQIADLEHLGGGTLSPSWQLRKQYLEERTKLEKLKLETFKLNKRLIDPAEEDRAAVQKELQDKEKQLELAIGDTTATKIGTTRMRLPQIERSRSIDDLTYGDIPNIFPDLLQQNEHEELAAGQITEDELGRRVYERLSPGQVNEMNRQLATMRTIGELPEARTRLDARRLLSANRGLQTSLRDITRLHRRSIDVNLDNIATASSDDEAFEQLKKRWIDCSDLLRSASLSVLDKASIQRRQIEIARQLSDLMSRGEIAPRVAAHGDQLSPALFIGNHGDEHEPCFATIQNGEIVIYQMPARIADYFLNRLPAQNRNMFVGRHMHISIVDPLQRRNELIKELEKFADNYENNLARIAVYKSVARQRDVINQLEEREVAGQNRVQEQLRELRSEDPIAPERLAEITNMVRQQERMRQSTAENLDMTLTGMENTLLSQLHERILKDLAASVRICTAWQKLAGPQNTDGSIAESAELTSVRLEIEQSLQGLNRLHADLRAGGNIVPFQEMVNLYLVDRRRQRDLANERVNRATELVMQEVSRITPDLLRELQRCSLQGERQIERLKKLELAANNDRVSESIATIEETSSIIGAFINDLESSDIPLVEVRNIEREIRTFIQPRVGDIDVAIGDLESLERAARLQMQAQVFESSRQNIDELNRLKERINQQTQPLFLGHASENRAALTNLQNAIDAISDTANGVLARQPEGEQVLSLPDLRQLSQTISDSVATFNQQIMPRAQALLAEEIARSRTAIVDRLNHILAVTERQMTQLNQTVLTPEEMTNEVLQLVSRDRDTIRQLLLVGTDPNTPRSQLRLIGQETDTLQQNALRHEPRIEAILLKERNLRQEFHTSVETRLQEAFEMLIQQSARINPISLPILEDRGQHPQLPASAAGTSTSLQYADVIAIRNDVNRSLVEVNGAIEEMTENELLPVPRLNEIAERAGRLQNTIQDNLSARMDDVVQQEQELQRNRVRHERDSTQQAVDHVEAQMSNFQRLPNLLQDPALEQQIIDMRNNLHQLQHEQEQLQIRIEAQPLSASEMAELEGMEERRADLAAVSEEVMDQHLAHLDRQNRTRQNLQNTREFIVDWQTTLDRLSAASDPERGALNRELTQYLNQVDEYLRQTSDLQTTAGALDEIDTFRGRQNNRHYGYQVTSMQRFDQRSQSRINDEELDQALAERQRALQEEIAAQRRLTALESVRRRQALHESDLDELIDWVRARREGMESIARQTGARTEPIAPITVAPVPPPAAEPATPLTRIQRLRQISRNVIGHVARALRNPHVNKVGVSQLGMYVHRQQAIERILASGSKFHSLDDKKLVNFVYKCLANVETPKKVFTEPQHAGNSSNAAINSPNEVPRSDLPAEIIRRENHAFIADHGIDPREYTDLVEKLGGKIPQLQDVPPSLGTRDFVYQNKNGVAFLGFHPGHGENKQLHPIIIPVTDKKLLKRMPADAHLSAKIKSQIENNASLKTNAQNISEDKSSEAASIKSNKSKSSTSKSSTASRKKQRS